MKTSELTGPALDWAVAEAEGGLRAMLILGGDVSYQLHVGSHLRAYWRPSEDWSQGGPIIDREIYSFSSDDNSGPEHGDTHKVRYAWHKDGTSRARGDTFLIAAMRCFVASRLGDEVDVPEELL